MSAPRPLVLLALDWIRPKDPRTSLGHASILARLRAEPGVRVAPLSFAVNAEDFDKRTVLEAVLAAGGGELAGGDVAIGAYVWNEAVVRWLLPALRRRGFSGRIILGGPQISYAPAGIDSAYPDADVFVRGYGEDALAALARGAPAASIPGVSLRGADRSETPAAIQLSTLPSPYLGAALAPTRFVRWETQRGCVFACSFCQHRESGARLRQNTLAPERIAAEIEHFVRTGATDIAVLDPIFNSNPAAVDILDRFRRLGYRGRLSLQCRFEMMTPELLDACEGLDVRLEFGLQTAVPAEMKAIGRMNDLARVDAAIRELHRRRIEFEVSLIYGLPEQTLASFAASVRWCQERGVETLKAFPLMLLRGTAMERHRDRWALVESDDPIPVVVGSSRFTREDWLAMRRLADGLEAEAGWGLGAGGAFAERSAVLE